MNQNLLQSSIIRTHQYLAQHIRFSKNPWGLDKLAASVLAAESKGQFTISELSQSIIFTSIQTVRRWGGVKDWCFLKGKTMLNILFYALYNQHAAVLQLGQH